MRASNLYPLLHLATLTFAQLSVRLTKHQGHATFDQLIDHDNPGLGTFKQHFWYDTKYWNGTGSPVVLTTPGEENVTLFGTFIPDLQKTEMYLYAAEKLGGALVIMEHRYWGLSSPFTELTTANLTYLTLHNAIHDLTYFANNVELPFDSHHRSNAGSAPWVLIGGSYSGALTAWTAHLCPGTFWAYLASSAVVQAWSDFWQYYVPIQEHMPKNCSKDVGLVIDHVDHVLTTGTAKQQHALKAQFGLETLTHNDDFGYFLSLNLQSWQSSQFAKSSSFPQFWQFCDYVENVFTKHDKSPGAEGVGLTRALDGWARWQRMTKDSKCVSCYDSYNKSSPRYTDLSLGNAYERQWQWMLCNEPFEWWQTGAPHGHPSIVSRLVTVEYFRRQCHLYFPPGPNGETFGLNRGRTPADINAYTGGWSITNLTRFMYSDGTWDPWRYATTSSPIRPGGPLKSTKDMPVLTVPRGTHEVDFYIPNARANKGDRIVVHAEIEHLQEWVKEWPGYH